MTHAQIRKQCTIDANLGDLQHAMEQLALSARAYDRILKVARTIADLAQAERIEIVEELDKVGAYSVLITTETNHSHS
jgi:magnesium chelatase family protein